MGHGAELNPAYIDALSIDLYDVRDDFVIQPALVWSQIRFQSQHLTIAVFLVFGKRPSDSDCANHSHRTTDPLYAFGLDALIKMGHEYDCDAVLLCEIRQRCQRGPQFLFDS